MRKKEYPPLLTLGFHPTSLADLRVMCVDNFPKSKTRADIMDGLEQVIGKLLAENIQGEVWVNGSFLTEKKDPKDSDILLYFDGEFFDGATPSQQNSVLWLKTDLKPGYKCDSYILPYYPRAHWWYNDLEWWKAYWMRQFGFTRKDEPKGLPVIKL